MTDIEQGFDDRALTEAEKAVYWFERARHYHSEVERLREALRAVRDTAHDDERVRIVDEALDAGLR